ncbi:probable cysteine--tRNA ligase, mitochondrial isoform X2 [Chrysoperla carnea]|uniref:probable cysteine--tRNA ligase, mitochondrial isoform X2 n=1 Tax=Chrysoperla carnea TaxID=189513 RepID=UPI001D08DB47|nr:probable cysteine--tRNA ligase, mitochondrial isoform X2 [Chrysoperla carnea]
MLLNQSKIFLRVGKSHIKRKLSRWIEPHGEKTNINIYNCVAKKKVPLIVKNKHFITWYTCGPTVYSPAHIGHACTYIRLDTIQNILKRFFNYNIVSVVNITDIDDKIIQRCTDSSLKEFTRRHENEFWDDMKQVGVQKPSIILRVTECIPQIINFIEKLIETERAYVTRNSNVYFDLTKYANYSKLQNISSNMHITDLHELDKRSTGDFALWKGAKPSEPYWESPWGRGRPGWHIECSVLGTIAFGNSIDIHAGGMDLRFPHHENEEAQSCCYHSVDQWVNYWIHTGSLNLPNSEKMSKSLGNTIRISDLLEKYTANEFRIACLISHYRDRIEFSADRMVTAKALYEKFLTFINFCDRFHKNSLLCTNEDRHLLEFNLKHSYITIVKAFEDDFDTPKVFNTLMNMMSYTYTTLNKSQSKRQTDDLYRNVDIILAEKNFILNILDVFGINLDVKYESNINLSRFEDIIDMCTEFRRDVRQVAIEKPVEPYQILFQLCDKLRGNLAKSGIQLRDEKDRSTWVDFRKKI